MATLVFLSYAPEDDVHRAALEKHLAPLVRDGALRLWHEGMLSPGDYKAEAIARSLDAAAVVLLLISADYVASARCSAQMTHAIDRANTRKARVVPILLRPCLDGRGPIEALEALPANKRPVTTWASSDDAWTDVVEGIALLLRGDEQARVDGPARPAPVPSPENENDRHRGDDDVLWLAKLEDARVRRRRLADAGESTSLVDEEIVALKRQLREGGQVRQGDILGNRYSLLKLIGEGGFATVWKAEDRHEHKRVAVKVLHPSRAKEPAGKARFFRGARVMSELAHPAIVRVIEPRAEDGGFCFFVMEYEPGGNLYEAVVNKRIQPAEVVPLIIRVGEALAEAHEKGCVHRDVKPQNILLDDDGAPKLADFDLVTATLDTTGGTRTGAMGSFGYSAPEMLSRPQDADARADVFGLGMTAIFCLYGSRLPDVMFRWPERVLAELRVGTVVDVLARAIEWNPADRFPEMRAFCTALRAAENSRRASPDSIQSSSTSDNAGSSHAVSHPEQLAEQYMQGMPSFMRVDQGSRATPDAGHGFVESTPVHPKSDAMRHPWQQRWGWVLGVVGTLLFVGASGVALAKLVGKSSSPAAFGSAITGAPLPSKNPLPSTTAALSASPSTDPLPSATLTANPGALNIVPSPGFGVLALRDRLAIHIRFRRIGPFIDDLERLLVLEPAAIDRADVRKMVVDSIVYSMVPTVSGGMSPDSERLFAFLQERAHAAGPDILFDLVTTRSDSRAAVHAEEVLRREGVRAAGTAAFKIAYDLRAAGTCAERSKLLERAKLDGDRRVLPSLFQMSHCGKEPTSCCLANDPLYKEVLRVINFKK